MIDIVEEIESRDEDKYDKGKEGEEKENDDEKDISGETYVAYATTEFTSDSTLRQTSYTTHQYPKDSQWIPTSSICRVRSYLTPGSGQSGSCPPPKHTNTGQKALRHMGVSPKATTEVDNQL